MSHTLEKPSNCMVCPYHVTREDRPDHELYNTAMLAGSSLPRDRSRTVTCSLIAEELSKKPVDSYTGSPHIVGSGSLKSGIKPPQNCPFPKREN